MNAILLVIPVIIIRYGVFGILGKDASSRVGFFPPTEGKEKTAYWIYQVSTLILLFGPAFYTLQWAGMSNYIGAAVYGTGLLFYLFASLNFGQPSEEGLNTQGLHSISRNPMYVAFFIYFLGLNLWIGSWILLLVLAVFQVAVHYLILSEERWCIEQFGDAYRDYMKQVRRYL